MSLSPALVASLEELTAPLDLSHDDLPRSIELLEDAARLVVGSLIGWTLTITVQGHPLTLTSIEAGTAPRQVRASLRVPFTYMSGSDTAEDVVLYAARADAFALFAIDIAGALHLPATELQLDHHLNPTLNCGITGLDQWSAHNQAMGQRIEQGNTTAATQAEPQRDGDVADLGAYRRSRTSSATTEPHPPPAYGPRRAKTRSPSCRPGCWTPVEGR